MILSGEGSGGKLQPRLALQPRYGKFLTGRPIHVHAGACIGQLPQGTKEQIYL